MILIYSCFLFFMKTSLFINWHIAVVGENRYMYLFVRMLKKYSYERSSNLVAVSTATSKLDLSITTICSMKIYNNVKTRDGDFVTIIQDYCNYVTTQLIRTNFRRNTFYGLLSAGTISISSNIN